MLESKGPLLGKTPKAWAQHVLQHFDLFLLDHASCERKAAALAMSFIGKYSDRTFLVEPMLSLAREELEHFGQVYRLLRRRGIVHIPSDDRDAYVQAILKELRHGREEHFLDRLIASAFIEERSSERFFVLSEHIEDDLELKTFYTNLAKREKAHYRVFVNIAEKYFTEEDVAEAISRIANIEYKAMMDTPITSRVH